MHLSPEEIQEMKGLLETQLAEKNSLLLPLQAQVKNLMSLGHKVDDELIKQKNQCENKIISVTKSLELIENKRYGFDIHTGEPISIAKLRNMPDLKVNNGPTPRPVTSFAGSGKSHLRT
jgi:RNA polymerase-binding transcription factor DksA